MVPAVLERRNFFAPTLEPEYLCRCGIDLPPRRDAYDRPEILAAIDEVSLGLEIADARFVDAKSVGMPSVVADNTGPGATIAGPCVADWRQHDLETVAISVVSDGAVLATGLRGPSRYTTADIPVWTVNELSRRDRGLHAGEVISTGTLTKPVPAESGQTYRIEFAGFGALALEMR